MEMEIVKVFNDNGNSEKAYSMKKYLKDNFEFLGIQKPLRNELQKDFICRFDKNAPLHRDLVKSLWNMEYREYQYFALDYLIKFKKNLEREDILLLEWMICNRSWWDTVDLIAINLVGEICRRYPDVIIQYILPWSKCDNLWLRRTSILFQLKYKDNVDTELLSTIILSNMDDDEFFIRKAIGWMLREYSKSNKEWVSEFINSYDLSPLSKREASKYLN